MYLLSRTKIRNMDKLMAGSNSVAGTVGDISLGSSELVLVWLLLLEVGLQ